MSLLNMNNVPGEQICGLDSETLEFVTHESNYRFLSELDPTIFDDLPIPDLTVDEEKSLRELEESAIPKTTQDQRRRTALKFRKFLEEKNLCKDFENVPDMILNNYLRLFYSSLKKEDGSYYAPQSLICFRAAIQRHLTSPEINRQVNIITGEQFKRANGVLKSLIGMYLKTGSEKNEKFSCIADSDLKKIYDYFTSEENVDDRSVLQKRVLFDILLHFQLRGRENLRFLTKDTFGFDKDNEDNEFVYIKTNLLHKNVKASLNSKEFLDLKKARMYSSSVNCPVENFKRYLDILPSVTKDNSLFPLITKNGNVSSSAVVGKHKLGSLLCDLSKKLELSKSYSNHCLRVTGISKLHDAGFSNAEICAVTGHKNERSLQRYLRVNEKSLKRASLTLSSTSVEKKTKVYESQISFQPKEDPRDIFKGGVFNNCTFNFFGGHSSNTST